MTWDLFVGIKLADTGFKGGGGGYYYYYFILKLRKMIRIKNHAHFFPTRYNMQDKNFLTSAYILHVQVRQDY